MNRRKFGKLVGGAFIGSAVSHSVLAKEICLPNGGGGEIRVVNAPSARQVAINTQALAYRLVYKQQGKTYRAWVRLKKPKALHDRVDFSLLFSKENKWIRTTFLRKVGLQSTQENSYTSRAVVTFDDATLPRGSPLFCMLVLDDGTYESPVFQIGGRA